MTCYDFLHGERAPWLPQVCQVVRSSSVVSTAVCREGGGREGGREEGGGCLYDTIVVVRFILMTDTRHPSSRARGAAARDVRSCDAADDAAAVDAVMVRS